MSQGQHHMLSGKQHSWLGNANWGSNLICITDELKNITAKTTECVIHQ